MGNTFTYYGGSTYQFTDADAECYYDALVTANGGEIDAFTLYGISLDTLKQGIDDFWIGVKADGDYTDLSAHAFYPMIGGTAATHAINGDCSGNDITWSGTVTHSATGSVSDGSTGYGDTGISTQFTINGDDFHISFYSGTNSPSGQGHNIGARTINSHWTGLQIASSTFFVAHSRTTGAGRVRVDGVTDSRGFFCGSRLISQTNLELYKNGSIFGTQAGYAGSPFGGILFILARQNNSVADSFSTLECRFASIGLALNASANSRLSARVNTLQTLLGRNVY